MKKILVISDVGSRVGLGHYSRAKILEKEIKLYFKNKYKIKQLFFSQDKKRDIFIKYYLIKKFYELEKNITNYNPDIIFLNNSKLFEKKYGNKILEILKKQLKKKIIISIDSYIKFYKNLNYVWIPNIEIEKKWKNIKRILWGWDKLLINKNKKRIIKKNNKKLIIITGGSDQYGLTRKLPQVLKKKLLFNNISISWLVGPYSPLPKKVDGLKINIISNKKNTSYLSSFNMGLVVFGVSFFEVLYNKIPCVVLIPPKKEKKILINKLKNNGIDVAFNIEQAIKKLLIIRNNFYKNKKKFNYLAKKIFFKNRKSFYKNLFSNNFNSLK